MIFCISNVKSMGHARKGIGRHSGLLSLPTKSHEIPISSNNYCMTEGLRFALFIQRPLIHLSVSAIAL